MARAGGFPLAGVEKWEREHPRWPHHALVRDRFGSWRTALQAAGLPTPPPLLIPRRERVQTAQRLEGRLSAEELADVLGVTTRTVRSYWRASTCARCGGPQISPDASSCPDCIPAVALRRAPKAEIIRALRRWTRETGAPPRITDWRKPGGKWEREYPAWPSAGDVQFRFGSWSRGLAAAGLRPHRRSWTTADIRLALRSWSALHGRVPHHGEWQSGGPGYPPASTVTNVFGSWSAALRAADLRPARHGAWTEDEVLEGFARVRAAVRPAANQRRSARHARQLISAGERGVPTLGSLRSALERLGHDPAWTPVGDEEVLDALRAYAREHGRAPAGTTWRRERRRPGASVIMRRHGRWSAALAAGLGAGTGSS